MGTGTGSLRLSLVGFTTACFVWSNRRGRGKKHWRRFWGIHGVVTIGENSDGGGVYRSTTQEGNFPIHDLTLADSK